jgi:uncharacterized protein YjdB
MIAFKGFLPAPAAVLAALVSAAGAAWAGFHAVASVASVEVSPATANGKVSDSGQLTATVRDSAGNVLAGRILTWSSSNTVVATVDNTGMVRAVGAGSAVITATSEGKSGQAQVTVTN